MYDKTAELLPNKFELNLPKYELDLSKFKLELNKPATLQFFKIEDINATSKQKFINPCSENSSKFQPIPNELWLKIFSYLNSNALVCAMISCKFFGEITNEQSIRISLGKRVELLNIARSINKKNLHFSEINSIHEVNFNFFKTPPLTHRCEIDIYQMKEKKELYQAGDKGFVMK